MSLENYNFINDIYYSKSYISLYLKENEEIFEFKYSENEKVFYNVAIKKPIYKIGNILLDEIYYDLETVYGYGGFYCNTNDEDFFNQAMSLYIEKCLEEKIIAEFLRFHPFNEFSINFKTKFDMIIYDRDVVVVDLSLNKDQLWQNYSSKTRKILRRCYKELDFIEANNIERFIDLYYQTMDKNQALDFYYFSKSYFNSLFEIDNIKNYEVRNEDRIISSAIFLFSNKFGYYHLSANDYNLRSFNANYIMLDKIFEIAKEKDVQYFILGGGVTNSKDDTLLVFKSKFSSIVKPFYIAGKIYNKKMYDKYLTTWESQTKVDKKYFLKYRLDLE